MIVYIAELLTVLMAVAAIAVIRVRDLFALVMLISVYSALLAMLMAVMGAPDVAFTEGVIGPSVSIVFFMALMWWINPMELTRHAPHRRVLAWAPALGIGALLLYGINALPAFGDPAAPPTQHVSPDYIAGSIPQTATPNVVAAVLGDYRSFDTMIEAAVVLTAALGCLLVLKIKDDPTV